MSTGVTAATQLIPKTSLKYISNTFFSFVLEVCLSRLVALPTRHGSSRLSCATFLLSFLHILQIVKFVEFSTGHECPRGFLLPLTELIPKTSMFITIFITFIVFLECKLLCIFFFCVVFYHWKVHFSYEIQIHTFKIDFSLISSLKKNLSFTGENMFLWHLRMDNWSTYILQSQRLLSFCLF